jgi:3-oxoacyl-[acyl-carrier protein] reductase
MATDSSAIDDHQPRELPMRLKDKVSIITGAAQGIGEAYARRFAQEGAKVTVCDVNEQKGRAVATSIGGDAIFQRVDVSDEEDTKRAAKAVFDRFGRIDVLINNAAIFYGIDNRDYSYAYLRKIFDVNFFGAWLMSRAVCPYMQQQNSGVIIHQSSTAAYMHPVLPMGDELPSFHYSITKSAINALTHHMAGALGIHGVRVNAISPGPTMTEATKQIVPQEYLDYIVNMMMAIKRPLDPEDLTGTAVWLASDDAKMVTGQVIPVDGGMVMLG